ncbi:hypothetical protein IMZ29_22235 [Achromobacter sp. GG226]|uniref:pilus assembly protein TadG-related protein n=1 Tax=Verticiella alkaliphila TaxID=2779529 RepID=UPI001C0AE9F5|nr:pilus assembly protein TadG-related protein [Verticiella sp. GG226]MBU4613157.1 hypothetical protein [Verticiella sp. GG226]
MAVTARTRQERGSIILPAAVAMVVSLILLASADIGYLFYMKRELQKSADLAAVAGAQMLGGGGASGTAEGRGNAHGAPSVSCAALGESAAQESARHIALENVSTAIVETASVEIDVRCGAWDNSINEQSPVSVFGDGDPSRPSTWRWRTVREDQNPEESVTAVWVTVSHPATGLFSFPWSSSEPASGERRVSAHAVAVKDAPFASFSVGSRLLDLEQGAVSQLLRVVGVDPVQAGILNYDGLIAARLTPAGLLNALGVPVQADLSIGEFDRLLALREVSLGELLDATVVAAGHSGLLSANAALLQAIRAKVPTVTPGTLLRLGSSANHRGVFARIESPPSVSAGSALWTEVSALNVLTAAIGVATTKHGAELPAKLGIPDLLDGVLQVRTTVIEPPSVAIGAEGTEAYNAQIRLSTRLCVGCGGLVGDLLTLVLGTKIGLAPLLRTDQMA